MARPGISAADLGTIASARFQIMTQRIMYVKVLREKRRPARPLPGIPTPETVFFFFCQDLNPWFAGS
jgi:hypothetical protein